MGACMKPPKATICSTGRSGSGYIAKVLQVYGISAGHEAYFCFPWKKPKQVEIDSSWIATDQLDDYNGVVFHQIRHPLKVLTSITATAKPWQPPVSKVWEVRKRMMRARTGSLIRDFSAMIVWMNKEIEKHKVYGWPVEDFSVDIFSGIFPYLDMEWDRDKAVEAIESVSSDYNKHHDKEYLTWEDLPDCEETEKLREMSNRYGY